MKRQDYRADRCLGILTTSTYFCNVCIFRAPAKARAVPELNGKNTSADAFAALVVVEVVFAIALASVISPRHRAEAALGIGSHLIGFAASTLLGTAKWFDLIEDISILGMLWWSYESIGKRTIPTANNRPCVRSGVVHTLALLLSFFALLLGVQTGGLQSSHMVTSSPATTAITCLVGRLGLMVLAELFLRVAACRCRWQS